MRRRPQRRGRPLLVALLAIVVAAAVWLVAARGTQNAAPPAAAIHAPPALKHRADNVAPSGKAPPPGIDLFGAHPVKLHFKHPPRAGLLFDVDNGQALWAHRPLRRLPIASLTKVMTAILTVENTGPHDRAKVTDEALAYSGSGVGVLPRDKDVPVEGLLAGLLLPSGNDAAIALAGHVAGNAKLFVRQMNARAKEMGLGCTHYVGPDGISDRNHSCPADLAALSRVAIAKPRIARIVRHEQLSVPFPIKTGRLWLYTTNPLLHLGYPGTIGLKTGSTERAGHCLIGIARRGTRTFGVVLLHSPNSGLQAEKLLDAAFRLRT
jgi:D-alanyl-D-alanine carboxypeptidase